MQTKYRLKVKDSFKTRLRFFKFACILDGDRFEEQSFLDFKLEEHEEFVDRITGQYYQWNPDDELEGFRNCMKIEDLYKQLGEETYDDKIADQWFEEYFKQFKERLPFAFFNDLVNADICAYCGLSLKEIENLADHQKIHKKYERGYVMEIDRKSPNLEYTKGNCVPSCYWCNNAKTDEFTYEEFRKIGPLIKQTLLNRLNNVNR